MFGGKSREIAAQRIEIAHLREERTAVLPHLEVAKSLAEKANELADPNNNLTDEQRASLHLQALQGGFALYLAKELRGIPNAERVELMQQLVGREALLEIFREPLKYASKATIVDLLGGASLGEAVELYKTFAGAEALQELLGKGITEKVSLFTNPLDLEATRKYSEMCGNIATDQWKLGNVIKFGFTRNDDTTEIARSITVAVTPYKKDAVLQVAKDTGPTKKESGWPEHPLREGTLIVIGSYIHGAKADRFMPQVREGDKLAYAYADVKNGSVREGLERLACVQMLNHATGSFEIVHGKMPQANE